MVHTLTLQSNYEHIFPSLQITWFGSVVTLLAWGMQTASFFPPQMHFPFHPGSVAGQLAHTDHCPCS